MEREACVCDRGHERSDLREEIIIIITIVACQVLYLQPIMIPPKRFDISPPHWGMLRRSRCVQIFLKTFYGLPYL